MEEGGSESQTAVVWIPESADFSACVSRTKSLGTDVFGCGERVCS